MQIVRYIKSIKRKQKKFENKDKNLGKLKSKIDKKKKELEILNNKQDVDLTTNDIKNKSKLKSEIEDYEKEVFSLENNIEEIGYFNSVIDFVLPYYDLIENSNNCNSKSKTVEIIDFFSSPC